MSVGHSETDGGATVIAFMAMPPRPHTGTAVSRGVLPPLQQTTSQVGADARSVGTNPRRNYPNRPVM